MRWWLRLAYYALPYRSGLTLLIVFMLSGVGLDVLKPWPLKLIVDNVLSGQPLPVAVDWITVLPGGSSSLGLLGWLTAGTVLLFLSHQGVIVAQEYLQAGIGTRLVYQLGAALFDHLQGLSLLFHSRQPTGDLVRRVTTDSSCIRDLMTGVFLPMLTALISLGTMFIVMWQLNPVMACIALLVAPLEGALIRIFDHPMTERTYQYQQLEGEMMALAEQTLTALPVVQAFSREEYEDGRFWKLAQRTLSAYLRALFSQLQFKVGVSGATAAGTAVLMSIGGLNVLKGALSVGDLLIFLAYLTALYLPMETLAYLSSGFASAAARARRVLEVLEVEEGVRDAVGAAPLPVRPAKERGHVHLEGISFGYEPGHPVLQQITLEARPGETVALVGPTGAGKSTLVSLIPRFFDPWEGRVLFDGVDVRQVQLASLRAQIALVLQEPFLLPLTVAENIAYGRPEASREEIIAAAVAANADEFIRHLPRGYDTVLGERGATLSGGQRQRLAIARALLKDAPVLILDEPTAALDAQTEALLLEALERLLVGRTTFIIAHRLATIQRADRIVVLERGCIVESGTQQALLAAHGAYAYLHRLQWGSPVEHGGTP
jgi:ATP-binding cassette subfamily B protein/subfamily B ATP-binding cassette protein MsbA